MSATRIEIAVDGRTYAVAIEPADAPGRYRVRVDDDAPVVIDATTVGAANAATTWSLRDVETGAVTTAAVSFGAAGEGEAVVDGHVVPVALVARRRRGKAVLGGGDGEQRVMAPMPVKVVKVLVAVGDTVAAKQGLVVVEAMKMENELTATRAGTVTQLSATEGESVEAGKLLVVVG
jgi:biotin carboxyl carrier protein